MMPPTLQRAVALTQEDFDALGYDLGTRRQPPAVFSLGAFFYARLVGRGSKAIREAFSQKVADFQKNTSIGWSTDTPLYIACHTDGEIIGMVVSDMDTPEWEVSIHVLEDFRRQGVASNLIRMASLLASLTEAVVWADAVTADGASLMTAVSKKCSWFQLDPTIRCWYELAPGRLHSSWNHGDDYDTEID